MFIDELSKKYPQYDLAHWSLMREEQGERTLKQVIELIKPKTVVEIGTHRGITAAYFAEHCENVITIDVEHSEEAEEIFRGYKNIKYYVVKDNKEKKAIIDIIPDIDLIFIDGDHTFTGINIDWGIVKEKCDKLLFHDYVNHPMMISVYNLVNMLPKDNLLTGNGFALFWRGKTFEYHNFQ